MSKLSKKQKWLVAGLLAVALCFGISPVTGAMHIMEGYLPMGFCVLWYVVSIPFVVWGFIQLKKSVEANRRNMAIIAMCGAFIFIVSSLKIPSVTGSCSHMTGTGLGALLFGPAAVSVLSVIVLLFQAILLAHGGITTLGANTFSMGIAGPFLSYGIYMLGKKFNFNKKVTVFVACFLGDLFTYCVTAFQLALAYPSEVGGFGASFVKFLGVFAPTQLPLAIIEGILSVIVIIALESYAKPEMISLGFIEQEA